MTYEEKQLLRQDLCARLPYNVMVECSIGTDVSIDCILNTSHIEKLMDDSLIVKPYLSPMESMTDEDMEDYARYKFKEDPIWEMVGFKRTGKGFINICCIYKIDKDKIDRTSQMIFQVNRESPLKNYKGINWLNKKMFDYRGLIPMGLALPAAEGMYKF